MPNWCNNNITIRGSKDTVEQLWKDAQAADGLLEAMVPPPENMFRGAIGQKEREQCAEQGIPNWYDWQVENWGTKWNVSIEGLEFHDNEDGTAEITGWFDSAWAPPTQAMETYGSENPDVSITLDYHESGMCFVGRMTVEGGEAEDDCIDYADCDSKTVRETIGADFDDEWAISENMEMWEDE